jgi:site-specific DNA-adenine methylase|nr:MAG TPA: DNA adenine methylase [Caudoviricetes sp.]
MRKQYLSAPLPFVGQKRMFAKEFVKVLKHYPNNAVFVDLFGGSGLLAHITKCQKPGSTVVYNDFDNYRRRLENIPHTNALLDKIREMVQTVPRKKALPKELKESILRLIEREEADNGYVDYITLSTSLLFSMKYATNLDRLRKETFYNTVRKCSYDLCFDYLDGLEVVSCDYRELFNKYKDIPNVVFLIDPPYLSTEVGTYTMDWGLSDYLDVLQTLVGTNYIYFTSNKSSIIELCEWMGRNNAIGNPFAGGEKIEFNAHEL